MARLNDFYKNDVNDQVYWMDTSDREGVFVFSFDKKKTFNLFEDYPHKLTKEEKAIFDKENPRWAEYFKGRS